LRLPPNIPKKKPINLLRLSLRLAAVKWCGANTWQQLQRVLLAVILLSSAAQSVHAATSAEWRYWDSDDGLADRYVDTISRDPSGAIWAMHGDVRAISRFDGRTFSKIQTPFSYNKRRFDTLDGKNGWVLEEDSLRHLQDGKWERFPEFGLASVASTLEPSSDYRILDLGQSSALLLLPDGLARFSAHTRRLERLPLPPAQSALGRLRTFERATDGSVWIVGDRGVARMFYGPAARVLYSWQEFPLGKLPVEHPAFPVACQSGELFVTAFKKGTQARVILHLKNGNWETIDRLPQSAQASFAWRDGRGDIWLASDLLYRKSAADPDAGWKEVEDPNSAVLSGAVHNVIVNPDGSFFLASPLGIALHVNMAWKALTNAKNPHGDRIQLNYPRLEAEGFRCRRLEIDCRQQSARPPARRYIRESCHR
jgi:streptogramin lyase